MNLIEEHSPTKNDEVFFHLLDELEVDWKNRYLNLKEKGLRQKALLEEQLQKDLGVLNFSIN